MVAVILREYIGRDVFPCAVLLPTSILVIPALLCPFIARILQHHARVEWQTKFMEMPLSMRTDLEAAQLLAYKYRAGARRAYLQTGALLLTFVLVVIVYQQTQERYMSGECVGCQLTTGDTVLLVSVFVLLAIVSVIGIRRLPKTIGTKTIKHAEIVDMENALKALVCWGIIWGFMYLLDPGHLNRDGTFASGYFLVMAMITFTCQLIWYPVYKTYKFARFADMKKTLDDVLADPVLAQSFEGFLMREFAVENYRFLVEVEKWKESKPADDQDLDAWLRVAVDIYATFVERSSLLEVNLSSATRMRLQLIYGKLSSNLTLESNTDKSVSGEPPNVQLNVFDNAVHEIKRLLTNDSLSRYFSSKEYKDAKKSSSYGQSLVGSESYIPASDMYRGSSFRISMSRIENINVKEGNPAFERW